MSQLEILAQPDDTTCGPTCLHAVYAFHGDDRPLQAVIDEVEALPRGGTLAALLGKAALARGYGAALYTYNLQVFDPSWFRPDAPPLRDRLAARREARTDARQRQALDAYLDYLDAGGTVHFEDLTPGLLARLAEGGRPVLAGVSATYLYGSTREHDGKADDVQGEPVGHFLVVRSVDLEADAVSIADPYLGGGRFDGRYYQVGVQRFLTALLLGIVSYDANLLVLTPPRGTSP